MKKKLRILGIRGIPAAHGGFETFAERLALYLVKRDWDVTVYCQEDGKGQIFEDVWRGVRRVRIPVSTSGAAGTIVFDWKSTLHAAWESGLVLTLGYNTAAFCAIYRLRGIPNVINMDGIEWKRAKWSKPVQMWFWLNELLGCWLGSHLVADNPGITDHLAKRVTRDKITMIPYGAELIQNSDPKLLDPYELVPGRYATLIARAEPENSILEIVRAWSCRPRGLQLVILGNYDQANPYHKLVLDAASNEVKFLGAIYDKAILQALRYHCVAYLHGHQVGGTNPSFLEAIGAGNPVIAHDNCFNRWVAGPSARYFKSSDELAIILEDVLEAPVTLEQMRQSSLARFHEAFTWEPVLAEYERLLSNWLSQ
jgi:glycosyltransferase involved in cell wall biosynthesis